MVPNRAWHQKWLSYMYHLCHHFDNLFSGIFINSISLFLLPWLQWQPQFLEKPFFINIRFCLRFVDGREWVWVGNEILIPKKVFIDLTNDVGWCFSKFFLELCNKFKVSTSRLFADEDYLEPCQTSMTEFFCENISQLKAVKCFVKRSIIDSWKIPKYASINLLIYTRVQLVKSNPSSEWA